MRRFQDPIMMFNYTSSDLVLIEDSGSAKKIMEMRGYTPLLPTKTRLNDLLYRATVKDMDRDEIILIRDLLAEVFTDDDAFVRKYHEFLRTKDLGFADKSNVSENFAELLAEIFYSDVESYSPYGMAMSTLVNKLKEDSVITKPNFKYGNFGLIDALGEFRKNLSKTEFISAHSREGYTRPAKYFSEIFDMMNRLTDELKEFSEIEQDVFNKTMMYIEEVLGDERFSKDFV